MPDEARLSRMETKIDKLADAMGTLIRVEERVITIFNRLDANDLRDAKIETRLTALEKVSNGRGYVFNIVDRAFWIVAAAGVALAFNYFKTGA